MSQASDFNAFLEDHVNLNQTRLNRLNDSVRAVTNYLQADTVIGASFKDVIPQGSYAHGTIIKPIGNKEYDADILLHLLEVPGFTAKDYVQAVYEALGRSTTYTGKRQRHTRCVRIDYANDFHIDVVPYVTRADGQNYITNRTTDQFERSDPDRFTEWLDIKNRITNGNLVKVVRLLKYLRDHKGRYVIPSVTLTAALAEQVSESVLLANPAAYSGVAATLNTLSTALVNHMAPYTTSAPYIADPGTGDNLAGRWKDENYVWFRNRFTTYAATIDTAYNTPKYNDALALWRDLFGPDFGTSPVQKSALSRAIAYGTKGLDGLRPESERLIEDYGYTKALNPNYSCTVTGYLADTSGFGKTSLPRRGNQVPKGRSIQFEVTTDVPQPDAIYWKIRNFGEEARLAGSLRGDIHQDNGSRRRSETTSYRGKHYVEAYVIKSGRIVARSRQYVVVT